MRRWLLIGALVTGCLPGAAWASVEVDLLLDKLVQKGVLSREEAAELRGEMAEFKEASNKQLAKEIVPKWTQNITMSGDMRLRTEHFWRDPGTSNSKTRNRQRARLRVGAKAKVTDQLEAGFRLATGTNLDPVSTNQTAADIFDKKDLFIDQMYLKYATLGGPLEALPATVWTGKFENPFFYTPLIWDGDLTFEGAAVTIAPTYGTVSPFFTAGVFPIDELNPNGEDPTLWGAQIGTGWNVAPNATEEWLKFLNVKGGLAYYDYKNLKHGIDTVSSNRFGNTANAQLSAAGTTVFQHDYNLLNLLGEINTQIASKPVKLYADYVKNTYLADDDEGFQLGFRVGKAEKPWAWEGGYFYQRLEPDAVLGQFSDSDFGDGGTNRSGHVYYASIGTLKNSTLGFKWFVTEEIEGSDLGIDRLQMDWVTKF
jgi:hypothetical protein